MSDQSKIKAKIAALLAKANGTDNEHEREAFMAKAQKLLEEHQLSMGDMIDGDDPVIHSKGMDADGKWIPSWHRHIFRALGHLYGCESVHVTSGMMKDGRYKDTWRQELVGRESAIITTELMWPWIKSEIMRIGRDLAKESGLPASREQRSVANALEQRIWQLVRANKPKKNDTRISAKNALVTIDRVKQVMDAHYGELSSGRGTSRTSGAAAREAAKGIGLHRQAGAASTPRLGGR